MTHVHKFERWERRLKRTLYGPWGRQKKGTIWYRGWRCRCGEEGYGVPKR